MNTTIFYTNGIGNTFCDANNIAQKIAATSKTPTKLIYNDATPPKAVEKISHDMSWGIAAGLSAVAGTITTVAAAILAPPLAPAAAAATAGHLVLFSKGKENHQNHLSFIQHMKQHVAQRLAKSVRKFFQKGGVHAVLIGHSQGAHVLQIALKCLQDLKHRISVITIGGLVTICPHQAQSVTNIINRGDWIAWGAPTYENLTITGLAPDSLSSCASKKRSYTSFTDHLGHSAKDYLHNPQFQFALRDAIE